MMLEGLRTYLELANGLTEVTRQRATAAARALVAQGEAGVDAVVPPPMRSQVAGMAEDLVATSKANRGLLLSLVRVEVERTISRLGLVSAAELEAATARARALDDRVHELERQLRAARLEAAPAPASTSSVGAFTSPRASRPKPTSTAAKAAGRRKATSPRVSIGEESPAPAPADLAKKTTKKTSKKTPGTATSTAGSPTRSTAQPPATSTRKSPAKSPAKSSGAAKKGRP